MKESQEKMFPHSEVKVRLLKLYLERYLSVLNLSKYVTDVYLFDLFCGEGIYEDGGKGSPIIITETIRNIYLANRRQISSTGSFHCHFNDLALEKTRKVKHEIETRKIHLPEIGNLKFTNEDYRNLVPIIDKKIKTFTKEKAFVFIDPYGYKDIKVADIKTLLSSKKSEVLLFLPTQFMFRFEKKGTPESLKEFIDELMPIGLWPESETGIDFIENLTNAFRQSIGGDYFVDSFIITRDRNQFFCLFFFTSHIYGFDRMLDAKWKIDAEEGRGWNYETEFSLFAQEQKQPNTIKFEKSLIEFISITHKSNGELYKFTLQNGHLPTHANEILEKVQSEGKLNVFTSDGKSSKKGAFYLSYRNYKDEPNKIFIQLK